MSDHSPMKCQRRRTDGEPCGQWAIPGTEACKHHAGVALEVHRAKGEANLLMQQAAREGQPRTHPAVVLLDACELAYTLMQHSADLPVESMGPEQWDRVTKSLDQAARIAKAALDADAQDRHVRALERRAGDQADGVEALLRAFVTALGQVWDGLTWDTPVVQSALVTALEEAP